MRRTCGPGSAVVETAKSRGRVDDVAAGKDIGLTDNGLAIKITTTVITLLSHWRHCDWFPGGVGLDSVCVYGLCW